MNVRIIIEGDGAPEGVYVAVYPLGQCGSVRELLKFVDTYLLTSLAELGALSLSPNLSKPGSSSDS